MRALRDCGILSHTTVLGRPDGIIVAVNPATCAFTRSLARQIDSVAAVTRKATVVLFFGIPAEPEYQEQLRRDLGLLAASRVVGRQWLRTELGLAGDEGPSLLVLRHGAVAAVAYASMLQNVAQWLPALLNAS